MNYLYSIFFVPFLIFFSFQPSFSETLSNSEFNIKTKTDINKNKVLLLESKIPFLISSITNQNQVIKKNNKADIFLNKALEDFKKADKYISRAKKEYKKGQKSLKKANLFYKRGDKSLTLIRVESKKANKIFDESFSDYKKGLEYLSNALDLYEIYLEEIKPNFLQQQ